MTDEKLENNETLEKKERVLTVKDPKYVAPVRAKIDEELKKVSNFTDDELAIMGWSSKYKAHSLIVKYGEKGVEDEFRNYEWFKPALEEYLDKKAKGLLPQPNQKDDEDEEGLDKEERKRREKERRRREKEERRKEKELERDRKKRVKELKKKFEDTREFSINEFYGFLKELGMSKGKVFELSLIDKAYIQVKRDGKLYFNIFIDNGRIVYKRGNL
ncbi:MAG TPA: hypothetical protein PLJ38_03175 [bacterium]|nr:hypothetical protein [bacterium]